ncbi:uncharacterized protein LOC133743848 [Rosa rugosa]|uniref:uncharacterized protein LOC133743848 n=1 Tax=Rosa rugosa TaxID=74645 RepID=UPI002B4140E7|nr:uncharacterized protein LOC133743848 [Rosa rugosa]XP_062027887.1 uncharacterized protein LOC133743848 [Rosa rugosa]
MVEWRPIILTEPEANDVLRQVQSKGVTIALDGLSRAKAVEAIDSFLKQYKECFWTIVISEITFAIREELLKSRNVIDVKLVREVVEYLSNRRRGVEKKKKDEGSADEEGSSSEEGSGSGSGEGEESEDEEDSDQDLKKEEESDEEIDDLKDDPITRQECIEDLLALSREKGLSVKEGEEDEILDMMIPYLRGCLMYTKGIMFFLKRVREHIDRCSTLNDLETVKAALESSIFREEYEDWKKDKREGDMADAEDQVNQLLKKNMGPTEEEGIAAPVNQIEEEKRVCRDITEVEEKETLTPLNLPEQAKESMGNAYSCIKESLERGGANKRKLAQI